MTFFVLDEAKVASPRWFRPLVPIGKVGTLVRSEVDTWPDFYLEKGKSSADLYFAGYAGLDLVSQRFVDVVQQNGLTGCHFHRVHAFMKDKTTPFDEPVYGLGVLGRCGKLQFERSKTVMKPGKNGGEYQSKVGWFFDESTWDGADFFVPAGTLALLTSEKALAVLGTLKTLRFRDAVEIEY